jgi:hypothetical protein
VNLPSRRALVIAVVAIELLAIVAWLASAAGAPSALLLVVAAIQVAIGGAVFMELGAAHPAVRVAAATLLFMIALLCSGVASDVAMR